MIDVRPWCLVLVLTLLIGSASRCWAQTAKPKAPVEEISLADRARAARKAKTDAAETTPKSKQVLTNDNLIVKRGSFDEVSLDEDNSEELLAAMQLYKKTHTQKQAETEISEWWENQKSTLDLLRQRAKQTNSNDPYGYNYSYPTDIKDYKKYQQDQRLRQLQTRDSYKTTEEINNQIRAMQSTLDHLRYGLRNMGITGAWLDEKRR